MFAISHSSLVRRTATTALVVVLLFAVLVSSAFAASTANTYPTVSANVAGQTAWTNRDNGRLSDDSRANAGGNAYMTVSGFGFAIPAGAVITGIEVNIEAYSTNGIFGQKNVTISLSPNGGTTWAPTTYTTSGLRSSAPDSNYLAGGPLTNWGRTWTVAEINSANFMVRLVTNNPALTGTFYLDSVFVRVTYTLSSTTTLTSSLNPSNVGDPVTFTATVTGSGATPTGNVTFRDNGIFLGTVALNASGVATYPTSALTGGSHSITATYNGNTTYATSYAALTQGVNQAPAITSPNAIVFNVGTAGTFTVTVTGYPFPTIVRTGDVLPGGVTFTDNGDGTGTLSGTPASGTVGTYNLTFTATNSLGTATQDFTLTVVKGDQTINFPAPASPAGYGTTFTINPTATSGLPVTVVATGVCTLAGNTVTMTSGTGVCTLTASQLGNDDYNAAPNVVRTVNAARATTNVTITSSANPSVLGQMVTFTVRVTSPGGTPTGTVTLTDTFGQVLGTQTLVGGIATFNINTLTVYRVLGIIFPHTITATYNGDTNFDSDTGTISQTVGTANTITTLVSSINPSALGQAVTFTATVIVAPPGAGQVAGGTVTFYDGAVSLGTGTVNASGVATFTTSALAMGSHPITAYFQGTNDYGTSTSPILVQIVRRPSTTTLVSSLNPSTYGQSVTFTATVTGPSLTPTGTVSFYDDTTLLGTSTLNGSAVATFGIANLTAGPHNITARYSGDSNFVPGTSAILVQTVNQAPLTVTADDKTVIYGAADPIFTYTYSGFVLGETLATSDVTGTPDCTTTVTTLSPVGTYPITCTIGTLTSNNYSFNIVDGTLTVGPKALTITADNQGKTYGFPLTFNGTEFTTAGLINADTVTSVTLTSAGTPANAPAGTYPIVPSAAVGTGLGNYTITYVNGTLTVGGNVLVIAANDRVGPNAKTYGDTIIFDGTTEFTVVSGLQPGDSVTSVTLTSPGAAANAVVGTYLITPSAAVGVGLSNYIIVYTNGQLEVNPRNLTFNPNNQTKVYGDLFTAYTGTFTGLMAFDNITPIYDSAGAVETAPVGVYDITVLLNDPGNRLGNYLVTIDPAPTATLTVTPRPLTVTPDNKTKVYGDVFTAFTGVITGIQNGDNITATYTSTGTPATAAVGGHPIIATLVDPDGMLGNYTVTNNAGTLTVTRRALIVISDSQSKIYGDVFTAFTGSFIGLQNGDDITATYASAGAPASATFGTYPITSTLVDPDSKLGNYNVTYNNGTLTVMRRTLVVTPTDRSKIYGDTLTPADFTGTVTGLQAGDNIIPVYASPGAIATATVGTYPITVTLNDPGGRLGNYDFTLNTGTLTVTERDLVVTSDDKYKDYGTWFIAFTGSINGIQNGENISANYASAGSPPAAAVGSYPITITLNDPTGKLGNYNVILNQGTLTVGSSVLTVTAYNQTIPYGSPDPAFTFSYSGFAAGDTPAVIDTPPTCTVSGSHTDIGIYSIVCGGGADNAYTFAYVPGTLTVTPRTLVVTPADKIKLYGNVFSAFTGTITGIQYGENITASYSSLGAPATAPVGTYDIDATLSDPDGRLGNYTVVYNTGTLTVEKRALTVSPDNKTKIYGDTFTAYTSIINGLQNADTVIVNYTSAGAAASATVSAPGPTYPITITLTDPGNILSNYDVTLNTATLTVTRRPLIVTPDNKAKTFGVDFTAFTGTVVGLQSGDIITETYSSPGAPASAPAGTYPITVTLSDPGGKLPNYAVTLNEGTLTVGVNVLTVTADNQTKVYGNPDPVFTFTYTGFQGSDTPAVIDTPPTCVVAVPHNAVGTFPITCSGGADNNYIFTYVPGTLTITPRALVVTPDNKTKVYGDTFTAFTGTVTGLQAGDNITVTYDSTGANGAAPVGTYPINATLVDPNNRLPNYTVTLNTATLTVTTRVLTVTPDNKSKVYGTAFTAFTGSVVGLQGGDSITVTYASPGAPATAAVGTYPITATLGDPGGILGNYAVTLNTGTLTVTVRDLVITPADKTKIYGDLFTAFTGTITGIQNADAITATYSSPGAAADAAIGTYTITATPNAPAGVLANYNVILNTGTLTVTQRILIVTPDDKAKAFGTTFTAFTGSVSGLVAGDNITPVYASTGAPAAAPAGTYPITVTLTDPDNKLPNYVVTLRTGTLTVGANVLTVTANNQTIVYGAVDPVFTFTYAGFQVGDTPAVLTVQPTCQVLVAHNAVGTYPISCSGGVDDNYIFTYVSGTLTVTPRALVVTPANKTKLYGDIFTAFTGTITGVQGGDNITVTYDSTGAAAAATVGTYPITAALSDPNNRLGNYTMTLNTGTLTVTPRALSVTPDDKNKVYGTVFTAFTGNIVGIQNADNITATYASTGAPAAAPIGPYPITATLNAPPGVLDNYTVTYNTGTLTVTGNVLIVTPADKTKVYGDIFSAFTGTVVGVQPGDNITATYASTGAAATATVGTYDITATLDDPLNRLGNYTVILNTGTLTVTQRSLVVTPDNQAKVFGTTFTAFTGVVTGLQNNDPITPFYASTGAPAAAAVGTYPITVTLNDPNNRLPNYTVTLNQGTMTVGNTILTVTANNQTKTYGDPDPVFTFTYSGFQGTDGPGVLTTEPTCQVLPAHNAVGPFPITCSGGVDENYTFAYVPATLTVTPRALTVTPDDKSKAYGDIFTAFTGTVTGLQSSDNITVVYGSTGALATAVVGTYPITVTLNDPGGRLANYTITLNTGTLTVTTRALIVTPTDQTKIYGDVFTAFTGTIVGLRNGDVVTATYASPGAVATATVGNYLITATAVGAPNVLANYAVVLNTGTLTVTQRDLVVTPADKYKTYGEVFTAFTGTLVGIQNGDAITATYSSTGAPASAPMGTYPITATLIDPTGRLPNYNVILNTGTLTVGLAIPTIAVDSDTNPSMVGQLVTFTATVSSPAGTPTGTVTFRDGATILGTGTLNAAGLATYSTSALTLGSHSITVVYGGDANFAGTTSAPYIQSVGLSLTTTTIASSANPSLLGQSVTFTATVSSTAGTPTGTVTFRDGATTLGTGTLNAAGVATFTTSTLAVGSHGITAAYGGDANFAVSTSFVLTQVVNRANTTTVITSDVNPSLLGQLVTFTATVTSTEGTPTGTVSFNEGANTLGTGTLNAAGVATFSTSTLTVGSHTIIAVYGGDANFAVSTSPALVQVVNRANTTTTITSSVNPSAYSQLVTFTATVSAAVSVPTGTVTFRDGATTLGTGTLVGGAATFSTSTLAAGSHNITADYGGDPNYNVSTSPVLIQVVNQAVPTTTITSDNNPSLYGQSVTFTATVTSGLGTPTGTVTFDEGAITLGTGTLNAAGVAVFNTSALAVGSHNITATYSGDATFTSSTSAVLVQVVNKLTPTVTTEIHDASHTVITSAPVGSVVHDAALVSGTGPVPTGTVAFRAFTNATCSGAGTAAGTIPLDAAGVAHPSTPATVGGSGLSFRASYSGDAIYTSATSACETFNAPPKITSADNTTFTVGTAGTFTVTADGYPAPTFTRAGDALPTGVTFDGITGVLSGTPAAGTDGTYNLIFTATNGVLPDDIQDFTLTVNKALAVISSLRADPNPTDASSVDFTVTFNDNVSNVDVADFSLTYLGPTGATVTTVAGSGSVYMVTVKTGSGNGLLRLDLMDNDTIQDTSGSPLGGLGPWNGNFTTGEYYVIDRTAPIVIASTPANNALVIGMSQLEVTFNKDVLNDGTAQAANSLANYLLVAPNDDGFQTVDCRGGLHAGDTAIPINAVTYDPARFTSTLQVNDSAELPVGTYRIYICGTTSITSPAGTKLNNGLNDTQINFTVITIGGGGGGDDGGGSGTTPVIIPATGFPMGKVTPLPEQSANDAYTSYGDLWLEIPRLGVKASIVGVPQKNGSWDVSWLWDQAGYLEGSAFPTGSGNSVLTSHVYLPNGKPGPFVSLNTLTWGDQIIIHAYGQQYVYEVRSATQVKPNAVSTMMKHEELAWLTLVTCRGYNETTDEYQHRVLIRAVLVKTK